VSLQPNSVLIVDDEASLRKTLSASLTASGFAVGEARSGEEAVTAIHGRPFDVVLLDINMPGIGGIEACRRIREASPHAGIVMITVRDFDDDKIRGLEAGADDYITKPFKLRELLARVRAVLRRTSLQAASEPTVVEIGQLKIDFERRLFWRKGEEIHLSPKEFDLLAFMIKNAGFPLTHVKLLRSIWGLEYGGELEYLRSYVRMLRKKIEDDPDDPKYILTEPWIGYRFSDCSDSEAKSAPVASKPRSSSA
jgi:two-component system, OmpR family, KDP operon response regulator KdpE